MAISKLPTNASLKQVIDKFEEISLQNFTNIDVIALSELPTEVKENQLVIITNENVNKIYFDTDTPSYSDLQTGDIYISCCGKNNLAYRYFIGKNKKICLSLISCYHFLQGTFVEKKIYCGKNNKWELINSNFIILDSVANEHKLGYYDDLAFTITKKDYSGSAMCEMKTDVSNELHIQTISSFKTQTDGSKIIGHTNVKLVNEATKIDLTPYSLLKVRAKFTGNATKKNYFSLSYGFFNEYDDNDLPDYLSCITIAQMSDEYIDYELDVSDLNGEFYFGITQKTKDSVKITIDSYTQQIGLYR